MAWADTGTVEVTRCREGPLHRLRFAWVTDADGAVLNGVELFGTLSHFISDESGGLGTYSVLLYDQFEADVLDGLGGGLAVNTTTHKHLRHLLDGSDRPRPIVVGGRHAFRLNYATAGLVGTFSLYYWPAVEPRLRGRMIR